MAPAREPQPRIGGGLHRQCHVRAQPEAEAVGGLVKLHIGLKVAGPDRDRARQPPSLEGGKTRPKKMAQFGVGAAAARIVRGRFCRSIRRRFVMQPAWMQVELYI